MITSLRLKNYRCFEDHVVKFQPKTVMVGSNNAGKSSIIEALRLVGIATERIKGSNPVRRPDWLNIPIINAGRRFDYSKLNIHWENIFNRYSDPPAEIIAKFASGITIKIYLGPDKANHVVIIGPDKKVVSSKGAASALAIPSLSVLPQITPLDKSEHKLYDPDYIKNNISGYLSSKHFRNQLLLFKGEFFNEFVDTVENEWPGVRLISADISKVEKGELITLDVKDRDFVGEIGPMGHGLQMWLQTIWFLTRTKGNDTIILDEPDVYMHPDLQRKLIRFINRLNKQWVVATHSVEIMSEVDYRDILVINRRLKASNFASSKPDVQQVMEKLGSSHNIHLARLWEAKKLILVEGEDMKLLSILHAKIFPDATKPISTIPNAGIDGWTGWKLALGGGLVIRNAMGEDIKIYCLFDRDYHLEDEINARLEEAKNKNIIIHIWSKKEIENYLLNVNTITRIINKKKKNNVHHEEIHKLLIDIADTFYDSTVYKFVEQFHAANKAQGPSQAHKQAKAYVDNFWNTENGKLSILSGKEFISTLSSRTQELYKANISSLALAYEIKQSELDKEVVDFISLIEN